MKKAVYSIIIVLSFLILFTISFVSIIKNGFDLFDMLIIALSLLGLADITYRFIKLKRKKEKL